MQLPRSECSVVQLFELRRPHPQRLAARLLSRSVPLWKLALYKRDYDRRPHESR